jgi:hypothetical protein
MLTRPTARLRCANSRKGMIGCAVRACQIRKIAIRTAAVVNAPSVRLSLQPASLVRMKA